jgi:hypothetical protein
MGDPPPTEEDDMKTLLTKVLGVTLALAAGLPAIGHAGHNLNHNETVLG